MPVTLQVSKRQRSADTSYAADCADGVSPIKSSTVMADASFAGGSTSAAQPRQLSASAQYVKRLKYSPPIACTVRMLLDSKVVQRAGRCRVRFPSFAGWQRQYHKVRIVGRVLSVVQSGHAGGGKQHLYDGSDDDDGNTSSDEDPRQARKKKGRRQGKDRCGGGRERPFTTLVVCDSTGMIEVRVVHPLLMSIPQNEHSLALPSWEAVMSGQHSLLSSSRRRGGGAAELSSSSWQLAIVAGDYVSCTAAIRLRPVLEVSRGEHEQILPSSTITQSAPRSFPFSSTTPYPSSEHYDSPRNNDEAPHSCVSHLIIHAQPTDAFTAEEDASLLSDESGRRQCLINYRTSLSSVSTQQGGHHNDTAFFSSSACRVVQDVNEVTFHALSVLDCMLRTKQQVSSAAQPAAINDHLLGPPLDSFQQVVLFPDHAAATNRNVVTAAPDVPSLPHTTDNNDEGGVAYRQPLQNAELPPSSAATACVSDTTAPPSMVFDPTLVVTFSETNHHTSAVFRPPPSLSSFLPAGARASPTSSSALKSVKGLSRGGQQLSSCPLSTRQQHPPLTSPPDRANDPVRNVLLSHRLRVVSGGTRQVLSDRHNVSSNSPWLDDGIPDNVMFRTNQQHVDGIAKYKTHTTMMRVPTSGNNAIDFFGDDAGCRTLPSSPAARRPPPSPPMAADKNSPSWVMSEYHHGSPTHLKPLAQIDSPELPSTVMNRSAQGLYDSSRHHVHMQYQQQPITRGVATADFFHSKEEFLSAEKVMRMNGHHHNHHSGLGPLRPHLQRPTMPIERPLTFPTQQQRCCWGGGGGVYEVPPRRPPTSAPRHTDPGFDNYHLLPQQPHHHHHYHKAHHQHFVPQHQHHPHSHHHQQYMPTFPQQQQQVIYPHDRGAPSYDHHRWHHHHVQHSFPSHSYHPQHYRHHGLYDAIPPDQLPRFNNLSGQSSMGFRTYQQ